MAFLAEMAPYEQDACNQDRYGNHRGIDETLLKGKVVPAIIDTKDHDAEGNTQHDKNDPAGIFPFPGKDKHGQQNKGRDVVHEEPAQLLPDR